MIAVLVVEVYALECSQLWMMKQEFRWWVLKVFMYALRLQSPKMSVSYVLLTMCVIMLGRAWHGPSGERGVGLMSRKGVAPGSCIS